MKPSPVPCISLILWANLVFFSAYGPISPDVIKRPRNQVGNSKEGDSAKYASFYSKCLLGEPNLFVKYSKIEKKKLSRSYISIRIFKTF